MSLAELRSAATASTQDRKQRLAGGVSIFRLAQAYREMPLSVRLGERHCLWYGSTGETARRCI